MKKTVIVCLKLFVAGGILYYIFSRIPIRDVFSSMKSAYVLYIVYGVALTLCIRVIEAYQMKLITMKQGLTLSVPKIYTISLITVFYGLFLPGYLAGGVIRWYKFSEHDKSPAEALVAIAFNRFVRITTTMLLGIIFWSIDVHLVMQHNMGFVFILFFFLICIMFFIFFDKRFTVYLCRFAHFIDATIIPRFMKGKIHKVINAVEQFHTFSLLDVIIIFALAIGGQLLGIFSFYLFSLSLNLDITLISLGWIRTVTSIVTTLPFSFSGIGLRETSLLYLLQPYGVSAPACVALSFILFGRIVFMGLLGGMLELKNIFISSHAYEQTCIDSHEKKDSRS